MTSAKRPRHMDGDELRWICPLLFLAGLALIAVSVAQFAGLLPTW